jgi:hypothetical protein
MTPESAAGSPANQNEPTPKTDANLCTAHERSSNFLQEMVPADFSRRLELQVVAMRDALHEALPWIEELVGAHETEKQICAALDMETDHYHEILTSVKKREL